MNISQILTKLKSLVYSKSEADTLLSSKASSSHKHTKSEITDFPTIPTKTSQLANDSGFLTSHQSLSNYSTLANTVKSLSISGKTITVTPGSGNAYTLTTQDTNTTYSNFVKSGSGAAAGLVPAPSTTAGTTKYLREDGTWQVPPDHTYTVNNATLTIQKNGTNVATFTANASSNATANIIVPTKVSQLTNDSGFLTSHQSLSNYVTSSNLSTALSDKVDRIDHGYKQITGNGTYSWCKLATITIRNGYINNPISFEIDGRGRERSILQVLFANVSNNDPSLTSFKSDLDTNFYIKKVATSTWELYGNYSEAWGSFTLYRVTSSINSNSVAIDTTLSNLSSAPSGTTRVSPSITVPTNTNQLTNGAGFITSSGSCASATTAYNLSVTSHGNCYINDGGADCGDPIDNQKCNLAIRSWWSVGFYDQCYGKYAIGMDLRNGIVRAQTLRAENTSAKGVQLGSYHIYVG